MFIFISSLMFFWGENREFLQKLYVWMQMFLKETMGFLNSNNPEFSSTFSTSRDWMWPEQQLEVGPHLRNGCFRWDEFHEKHFSPKNLNFIRLWLGVVVVGWFLLSSLIAPKKWVVGRRLFPFGSLPVFRCELLVSGRVYLSYVLVTYFLGEGFDSTRQPSWYKQSNRQRQT